MAFSVDRDAIDNARHTAEELVSTLSALLEQDYNGDTNYTSATGECLEFLARRARELVAEIGELG